MKMLDKIDIYDVNGKVITTALLEEGSKVCMKLMDSDSVVLKFTSDELYRFKRGCYCLVPSLKNSNVTKKYVACSTLTPTFDSETGAYKYDITFQAWYYVWDRYLLCLNPMYGAVQSSFAFTSGIKEHVELIAMQLKNIIDKEYDRSIELPSEFAFHYNGRIEYYSAKDGNLEHDYTEDTELVDENTSDFICILKDEESKSISYNNVTILSAIGAICAEEAFNCEWWVDEYNIMHFGRCEFGDPITWNRSNAELSRSDSSGEYGTRLVAFGAQTNLPSRYRKKLIFDASEVHVKNGYTHFTDYFRKPPIKHNTGTKYLGFVAAATIDHSQTTAIEHEYIDELIEKNPASTSNNRYLGRKTTTWQGRDMYDCVEKTDVYHDYKIVTYRVNGGDKVVIKGMPSYFNAHYLYRYNSEAGGGNVYSDFFTAGEVNVEVRPQNDCVMDITVSGSVVVEYYSATYISFHNIANVNELVLPKLEPGKYRVEVNDLEMEYRINGEFKGSADRQSFVDIEVYEEGAITMDVINGSDVYIDTPKFYIDIYRLDYYIVQTYVEFLTGSMAGRRFRAFLNMDEDTLSTNEMKAKELFLSPDSFHVSIAQTSGIRNGDKFLVEGFSLEDVQLSYFTDDYDADTNIASYERRLMLPVDSYPENYINSERISSQEEVVTIVKMFDDIYPSQKLSIAMVETYTENVQKTDDNGNTFYEDATRYRFFIKKDDLDFKKAYITEGNELQCKFQDGLIGGLTFSLMFEGNTQKKDSEGNELQAYVVISNNNNGIEIPNKTLRPKAGDTIVLLNYNPMALQDMGLVDNAEERLAEAARAYLDKISLDTGTYTAKVLPDVAESILKKGNGYPTVGSKIILEDSVYFEEPRETRIIGFEYCLDIPYDSPIFTIGESAKYSRLTAIEKSAGGGSVSTSNSSSNKTSNSNSNSSSSTGGGSTPGGGGGEGGGISDAPQDGKTYGRKDGEWEPVSVTKEDLGLDKVDNTHDKDKTVARAAVADSVDWDNIENVPASFPPSSHNHDSRYYTESEVDAKLGGKSNTGHKHTKNEITDFPTSMPASDVYGWAKSATKPSYEWSEITGKPTEFVPSTHYHYNIANQLGYKDIVKNDNAGAPVYFLIAEVTDWYNATQNIKSRFFTGIIFDTRAGGYLNNEVIHINCGASWGNNGVATSKSLTTTNSRVIPQIIKYNEKYYISIKVTGSGRTLRFLGRFENCDETWTQLTNVNVAEVIYDATIYQNVVQSEKDAWAAKWDYNENTIKGVKVNNAVQADNATQANNADTLDNLHASSFVRSDAGYYIGHYDLNNIPKNITQTVSIGWDDYQQYPYAGSLALTFVGRSSLKSLMLLFPDYTGKKEPIIYTAIDNTGDWAERSRIALTTSNVASATKLNTSRTLWGQPFDGTANISGSLSNVDNISLDGEDGISYGYDINANTVGGLEFKSKKTNSTKVVFDDDGKVGIGTTAPGYKLDVNGTLRTTGTTYHDAINTHFGTNGIYIAADTTNGGGSINVQKNHGWTANAIKIASDGKVGIGTSSPSYKLHVDGDVYGTGTVYCGNGSNKVQITSDATRAKIGCGGEHISIVGSNGNVGIGTTTPSEKLEVAGNILASGDVTAFSDRRLKQNIRALADRGALNPVSFTMNGKECIGFVAQDVMELYPELVKLEENGYYSLNYQALTAVLAVQINELKKEVYGGFNWKCKNFVRRIHKFIKGLV